MQDFDPNSAASEDSGIFGLPYSEKEASLVLLPVPWEATTSYGGGTSNGPAAVLEASYQVDLFDDEIEKPYTPGIFLLPEAKEVKKWNTEAKKKAKGIIAAGGNIGKNAKLKQALRDVNVLSEKLNEYVFEETTRLLEAKKIVGLLGGDHSIPFGAFEAAGNIFGKYGILHFDAHSDTRIAYEGFTHSHASIMHNTLENVPAVEKLVQVGIRDFCEQESQYVNSQGKRVSVFYDSAIAKRKFQGATWDTIAQEIVEALPKQVWVSFDIDGLDPRFCPNTGTPVPGGLDFREANYVLSLLVKSGRKIIGFDLNEVAPDPKAANEWDANVGARLLYKLCGWTLASQGKVSLRQS